MTVNIDQTETGALLTDLDCEKTAFLLLKQTAERTRAPLDLSVDILLCGEETIRELNNQYRGIDRATDVLSFPNIDFEKPCLWPDPVTDDLTDPDSGEIMLGSVALCAERVVSQAKEYGHSLKREYAFLLTHSFLHLCGYDHISDQERKVMEEEQRQILNDLGITRD